MSPFAGTVGPMTRTLYPVLPTKSAAEVNKELSELRALLGHNQDTANSDRVEGKYTDFNIICDDGTVFKVHKLIVCPQVVAIDLALKKCFKVWMMVVVPFITDRRKEGQTNQYFLREQNSAVVRRFLDFVYGTSSELYYIGDAVPIEQGSVLLMAKVFALADELQAERVFSYCLAWLKLVVPLWGNIGDDSVVGDVIDGMKYIYNNAHRKESIITCFISACVTAVTKTEGEHNRILGWFRLAPEYNSDFLESLLTVSGNILYKLFGGDNIGKDSVGEDSAGEDSAGDDSAGEDSAGDDSAVEDSAGEDSAGEDSVGEDSHVENPVTENPVAENPVAENPIGESSISEICLDGIWAADGVDEIVVDGCSGGKALQLSRLWEHNGFRDAVVEAALLGEITSCLVQEALQLADSIRKIADADRCIIDYETDSLRFCTDCNSLLWSKSEIPRSRPACCSSRRSYYSDSRTVTKIVEVDEEGEELRSLPIHQAG